MTHLRHSRAGRPLHNRHSRAEPALVKTGAGIQGWERGWVPVSTGTTGPAHPPPSFPRRETLAQPSFSRRACPRVGGGGNPGVGEGMGSRLHGNDGASALTLTQVGVTQRSPNAGIYARHGASSRRRKWAVTSAGPIRLGNPGSRRSLNPFTQSSADASSARIEGRTQGPTKREQQRTPTAEAVGLQRRATAARSEAWSS